MVINGKSWPHTERLSYTQGDHGSVAVDQPHGVSHPMHLHGFYFHVESRGDWRSERVFRGDERPFVVTISCPRARRCASGGCPSDQETGSSTATSPFHVSHHHDAATGTPRSASHHAERHGSRRTAWRAWSSASVSTPGASRPHGAPPRAGLRANPTAGAVVAPKRFGHTGRARVCGSGGTAPSRRAIRSSSRARRFVLQRGEPVRITVVNHLDEPTAVHWHGIELESFPDGVPGWSGSPGPHHAADRTGRLLRRRVRAASRGHVHLSHPRERAAPDGLRPLRRAARRRLGRTLRSRDRQADPGRRRRPGGLAAAVRLREPGPGQWERQSSAARPERRQGLPLPADQHQC